jgi:hypothetical protein
MRGDAHRTGGGPRRTAQPLRRKSQGREIWRCQRACNLGAEKFGAVTAPKISGLRNLAQSLRQKSQGREIWRKRRAAGRGPPPEATAAVPSCPREKQDVSFAN